ncbi:hypothetical protein HanRHA438_Chr16g0760611 [Helianthus annuus]|nr:putative glycosyltransferase HPAT/SRGT1 [Helianthus annuus]KAJ0644844.1 putative glycosyltransferase HPAT/SRGT1 [Helianthus annuus]KAJ0821248.1 hypothetical protein HanPSC8_Chr16g0717781 [Helianthus annuus]KAJ0835898.1 hypothetical protein HanRHA438_Chr16g0760611 [Helianthus annuus]
MFSFMSKTELNQQCCLCVHGIFRYPAINKPAAVLHWLNHVQTDAEYIVILDTDMILKGPITPWEFKAARGRPVSTPYEQDTLYYSWQNDILVRLDVLGNK